MLFLFFKGTMIILFGVNVHILLFVGKYTYTYENVTNSMNITEEIPIEVFDCYNSNFYELHPFWDRVHLGVYCFGPFLITIISNLLIISKLFGTNSALGGIRDKKKKRLVKIILMISFAFILCALPQVISFGFFFEELSSTMVGIVILPLSDLINFTFNAFNFIIYFFANNAFRNECIYQMNCFIITIQVYYYKASAKFGCVSAQEIRDMDFELTQRTNRYYQNRGGMTTSYKKSNTMN